MARPLRIEYPGAWYHVMNRGAARKKIFFSDKDRTEFLKLLGEATEMFKIQIHAYSLMDNHYHLLVHTPEGKLGRAMRQINGVYTQGFNYRHLLDGPLFRGRYKALLIDREEYLLELIRYIHLNPVEAGICANPADHLWTSHRAYLKGKGENNSWLVADEILGRFGREERKARQELHEFVCAGVPERFKKSLEASPFILGSRAFQEWVYGNFAESRADTATHKATTSSLGMKEILRHIAFAHGLTVAELRARKERKRDDARAMAIYLGRRMTGIPHKDLARWLNGSGEHMTTKAYQRFQERLNREKRLRKLTREIEKSIWSHVRT